MDHHKIKEKLLAFHDPELSNEERQELKNHISQCAECRAIAKRWEMISSTLDRSFSIEPSEAFVNNVMNRLANSEEAQAPTISRWALPKWLFPALGYGFAFFLMFMAISYRELPVNTETVLLSGVPQSSHWTFGAEPPDVNKLVELP